MSFDYSYPNIHYIRSLATYVSRILDSLPEDITEIKLPGDILYSYYRIHPESENPDTPIISYETLKEYIIETAKNLSISDNELSDTIRLQKQLTLSYNNFFDNFWYTNRLITIPGAIQINLSRFKKLENFYISQIYCSEIQKIPPTLKYLSCKSCKLTKLGKIPKTAIMINCSGNRLKVLPKLNHTKLQSLFCSGNQIRRIPKLPNTVEWLYCYDNILLKLPEELSESLEFLSCSDNDLTKLPTRLPPKIKGMYIENNFIYSIPELPKTLVDLFFSNNRVSKMPDLPNNLRRISCHTNPLREYVPLPPSVRYANIDGTLMEI